MATTNGTYKPNKTTQRAQQYDGKDNKLHLNTIPIPKVGPTDLLVKIGCASLCHSDLMHFEPNDQGLLISQEPVTIGHEATGWVAELGSGVKGFNVGDPVGFIPAYGCCFECSNCTDVYVTPIFPHEMLTFAVTIPCTVITE
jgi:alcohol dehydrogenase, propanol-preferring